MNESGNGGVRPRALPEGDRVRKALGRVELPPWVVGRDFRLAEGWDGDLIVWVYLAVADDAPRDQWPALSQRATHEIADAFYEEGVDRWPLLRMAPATVAPSGA